MAGLRRDVVAARRVVDMDVGSSDAPGKDMRKAIERLGNAAAGDYGTGGPLVVAVLVSSSKGFCGFQE